MRTGLAEIITLAVEDSTSLKHLGSSLGYTISATVVRALTRVLSSDVDDGVVGVVADRKGAAAVDRKGAGVESDRFRVGGANEALGDWSISNVAYDAYPGRGAECGAAETYDVLAVRKECDKGGGA